MGAVGRVWAAAFGTCRQKLASVSAGANVIAYLHGRILEKQPNRIVVDVSAVTFVDLHGLRTLDV